MEPSKWNEMIGMLSDPYYDREFFTNLFYCVDRKKSVRDLFEGFVGQMNSDTKTSDELDKSLLQLFYAFQASSLVNESYQWLPMGQAMYSASLFRGNGREVLGYRDFITTEPQASTAEEFAQLIRKETRAVESPEKAWASLLFLLNHRTSRTQAISTLLSYSVMNSDPLSLQLLSKAVDVAMACGWNSNAVVLARPFARFWTHPKPLEVVNQGWRLSRAVSHFAEGDGAWEESWAEEVWNRLSQQTPEAAWEKIESMFKKGMTFDQAFALLGCLRSRALYYMKSDQWPRATASLLYGESLQTVARWCPEIRTQLLATSVVELSKLAQLVVDVTPLKPSGARILDGASKNISKDRLILRLDDLVERGERHEALEVMSVILKDQGLSQSVCDRLILMASKQDGWTFDQRTMATAVAVTKGYDQALRTGLQGAFLSDAIFGLLRFLSDEREASTQVTRATGTYGDGLPKSQYDVSGGARIVDRFVFNQMRNAQKIKIWPSDH